MTDATAQLDGKTVIIDFGENTDVAAAAALRAESAAIAAQTAAGLDEYADTAAGLAGTTEGEFFWVNNGSGIGIIYRHDAGPVATEIRRFIVDPEGPDAASLLGADDGVAGARYTNVQGAITFLTSRNEINVLDRGLTNDGTNCQAAMTALMQDSTAKIIRFPPGIYRAYLNNSISGRTFIFDEGAIIDGTVHIAVGTGPDTHAVPTITWVDDTRVIGVVTSTVRVGSFYCRGLNIDKVVITEVDSAYVNQTAEGGSNGVHFYVGSKDVEVGEIICKSATDGVYALGVDRAVTVDADSKPENIHIGRLIVRDCTQSIISTNDTINLTIDEVIADSWDTFAAMSLTADTNLRIGKITAIGSPATPSKDGIYVLNGISASFGEVEISGSTQIGFRTFNCGRVDVGVIRSSGNALDQVRIESPGNIGRIETSGGGTGVGVLIQGNATGLQVGSISDNGGGGVTVTADDIVANRVVSKNNLAAGKYGLNLNGADRFVNEYLNVDTNAQGLRMTTVADPTFGDMFISNNTTGIAGSAVTGLAYRTVTYSGNGTDTNITLNTVAGFKGSLVRQSVASIGNADVALTVGTSAVTQVCATSLTANRTVTLPTTGVRNGDKFRIARTAASGGAFNLAVTAIGGLGTVNLATSQWLEVEYVSGWQMTAKGSL